MASVFQSQTFGDVTAGDGNYIFQGIQNAPLDSALKQDRFRKGVPPPLNSYFCGREREVAEIKAAFREAPAGEQKRYVIYGMAGIGKSEICVKLLNDMRNEFWGIFWIDVSDFASAEEDFKKIANGIRPGRTHQALADALSVLAEVDFNTHPWLLILDNADERSRDYATLFPPVPDGWILMTSRNHECAFHESVGCKELEPIEDPTQLLFKAAKLRPQAWDSYRAQAETITNLLGSHTLALVHAGAYISRDRRHWNEFPQIFKKDCQRLLRTAPRQGQSKYRDTYATFEVSARALESDGDIETKDALCLLRIFAMLHHNGFPTSVFEDASRGLGYAEIVGYGNRIGRLSKSLASLLPAFLSDSRDSTLRLQEALHCLESFSFIKQATIDDDPDGAKMVSMHPLTHIWAKDRLDKRLQEEAWMMTGSIIAFSTKAGSQSPDYWNAEKWRLLVRQLQSHITSFSDYRVACKPPDPWAVELLQVDERVAKILWEFELYETKEVFLLEVFKTLEAEPSRLEHPSLLHFHQHMARVWSQLRKYSSSLDLWQQIISFREANAFFDTTLIHSMQQAAATCFDNGATQEAITQYENIVSVYRKNGRSADDRALLHMQFNIGYGYRTTGQVKKAVELLEHVVQVQQRICTETSVLLFASRQELGTAYRKNGQAKEAIELLEHVVQTWQRILPETSIRLLALQHNLGKAYLKNEQSKEAIELFEHVVRVGQGTLAETAPNLLDSQVELGRAYRTAKRHQEALQLFEHVTRVHKTTLSSGDPRRLAALSCLSDMYIKLGQSEKAKEVVVKINDGFQSLPKDNAKRGKLGEWLAAQKQYFAMEEQS